MELLEKVLVGALLVALLSSLVICYQVYYLGNKKYKKGFSTWQMPMIFAVLADVIYILG